MEASRTPGAPTARVGRTTLVGSAALPAYRPVRSSETCRPNELLIRANAQIEAAFLPSSTCESCEVVRSVRSDN